MSKLLSALLFLSLSFSSLVYAQETKEAEPLAPHQMMPHFPMPDETVLHLLTNKDIAYPEAWWIQAQIGASFYDARRDILVGRWSPGFQVGKRHNRFGYFLNVQLDQSFDFTQEVKRLDVIHIGPGVESLALLGKVRSSLTGGLAILANDTDIDDRGKVGWYVDFRPIAFRWDVGHKRVIELSPLSVNLSVPVTEGIPLILFSYFTTVSMEWAGERAWFQ